jgi:hypothetical protein
VYISPSFRAGDAGWSSTGMVLTDEFETVTFPTKARNRCVEVTSGEVTKSLPRRDQQKKKGEDQKTW